MRHAPHRGLQRVDLREDDRKVEDAQQLRQAAHHEHIGSALVALGRTTQLLVPLAEQPGALLVAAPYDRVLARRVVHRLTRYSNSRFSTKVSSWISRWSKLVMFSSNSLTKYGTFASSSARV